jgi:CheY-like chemotaxis protein
MLKPVRRVLVVDDNPADIDLVRAALQASAYGVEIESVGDGEEAMSFLKRRGIYENKLRPDLVMLDLNLPKKDGKAVLAEVRSDMELRAIPIVVFSTSGALLDIVRSYELGANCYVSKPGNLKDYFSTVQSIARYWFGIASLPRKED